MAHQRVLVLLVVVMLILIPSSAFAEHGTATVSDIDGNGLGIFAGNYTHVSGSSGDHPWYTFNASTGQQVTVSLETDFVGGFSDGSYLWIYEVLDGNAAVGDASPAELSELANSNDDPGFTFDDDQSHLVTFVAPNTNQYIVQVDSWNGGSGPYELEISVIPEPSSLCLAAVSLLGVGFCRRRRA